MDLEIWIIRIKKAVGAISPFYLVTASLTLFILFFTIFGGQGLIKLGEIKKVNHNMKSEIAFLKDQIKDRERQMKLMEDPVYLETVVRQELGYVKPWEVIFQLTP